MAARGSRRGDEPSVGLATCSRYGALVRRGPTPAAAGLSESSNETWSEPLLTSRSRADGTTPESASPRLKIGIRRVADNVIVSMHGQLTAESGAGIGHVLRDLICDQGNLHLVIDVDEVTDVDAHGLAALVEADRLARQCGAALTVRHPPEPIRKALDASGRTLVVEIERADPGLALSAPELSTTSATSWKGATTAPLAEMAAARSGGGDRLLKT